MKNFKIGTPSQLQSDHVALEEMQREIYTKTSAKRQDGDAFTQMNMEEQNTYNEYQRRLQLSREPSLNSSQ